MRYLEDILKSFDFGPGEVSYEKCIFKIGSNKDFYDFLIFFDSRGYKKDNEDYSELTTLLIDYIKSKNASALIINRPKNLTVFPTLINFLSLNNIEFKYLLTNLGFVDCTPKKIEFIEDIEKQIYPFYKSTLSKIKLEKYLLLSGNHATLYSIEYSSRLIKYIVERIIKSFSSSFFVNTPEISTSHIFKRKRPSSFYKRLSSSNVLVNNICRQSNGILIDIHKIENPTFDGVHYTQKGVFDIFNKIKSSLDSCFI